MAVRLLAVLCSVLAMGGIALAGLELQRVLAGTPPAAIEAAVNAATPQSQPPQPSQRKVDAWPALFGPLKVVEPQPPSPPTPPAPPTPPVSSLGYTLRGTVVLGGETWAILSHPTGDLILSAGDELTDGVQVLGVNAQGLVLNTSRGREVLEFSQ